MISLPSGHRRAGRARTSIETVNSTTCPHCSSSTSTNLNCKHTQSEPNGRLNHVRKLFKEWGLKDRAVIVRKRSGATRRGEMREIMEVKCVKRLPAEWVRAGQVLHGERVSKPHGLKYRRWEIFSRVMG